MPRFSLPVQLVLSATLAAADMIGVSWCFAALPLDSRASIATSLLLVPPLLVMTITFARAVIALNQPERKIP